MGPLVTGATTHFLTARAAARRMVGRGSGVILTLSTSAAALSGRDRKFHRTGGFGVACAAIEALTKQLAAELGPRGVRVVCLRPDAIPETWPEEETREQASEAGRGTEKTVSDVPAYMEGGTLLGRLPTLAEVGNAAAFVASDRASAMTGTVANLTCGSIVGWARRPGRCYDPRSSGRETLLSAKLRCSPAVRHCWPSLFRTRSSIERPEATAA